MQLQLIRDEMLVLWMPLKRPVFGIRHNAGPRLLPESLVPHASRGLCAAGEHSWEGGLRGWTGLHHLH